MLDKDTLRTYYGIGETRAYGIGSTLAKIGKAVLDLHGHKVTVLANPKDRNVIELHQNAFLGVRLSDMVTKLEEGLQTKFLIRRTFDLKNPKSVKEYEEFRKQMLNWFS